MKRIESSGEQENAIEARMDEQFAYERFVRSLAGATRSDLEEMCKLLAKQAMVLYPSAMRYMAKEAARNLTEGLNRGKPQLADELVELVMGGKEVSSDTPPPKA